MKKKNNNKNNINENKYTTQEESILNEIYNFCEKECGSCLNCPEEECVLYRIEKLIVKEN